MLKNVSLNTYMYQLQMLNNVLKIVIIKFGIMMVKKSNARIAHNVIKNKFIIQYH